MKTLRLGILAVSLYLFPAVLLGIDFGGFGGILGGSDDDGGTTIDLGKIFSGAKDIKRTITGIDEEDEIAIGREAAALLLGAAPAVDNPAIQNYVNRVGRWVVTHTERPNLPWRFCVLDSPTINAFATPGGYIFITRGLLATMNSEAELAGVLAHEVAHVVRKHHVEAMSSLSTSGLSGIVKLVSATSEARDNQMATELVGALKDLYLRGLDKKYEFEADQMGVVIAARAGYDPYGLVAVLQTLDSINPEHDSLALMYKTHPTAAERLTELDYRLGKLESYSDLPQVEKRFQNTLNAAR